MEKRVQNLLDEMKSLNIVHLIGEIFELEEENKIPQPEEGWYDLRIHYYVDDIFIPEFEKEWIINKKDYQLFGINMLDEPFVFVADRSPYKGNPFSPISRPYLNIATFFYIKREGELDELKEFLKESDYEFEDLLLIFESNIKDSKKFTTR